MQEVRPGDLWCLGNHRLLCGDSTNSEDLARLMDGGKCDLLFTSPPYPDKRKYASEGVGNWNDLMFGVFGEHLDDIMKKDGQILVNLGLVHKNNEWHPYWDEWVEWMRGLGWRRFGLYVWDQGHGLPGDWVGRLAPSFELLFHFNKKARKPNKIIPCKWAGQVREYRTALRHKNGAVDVWTHQGRPTQPMRIPDNVVRVMRHMARGVEVKHPAVFPIKLAEFIINAYSSEGDVVFEPFAGSGTTLIAGERTGRRVYAVELAPEYVDIALARWVKVFPEIRPVLHGRDVGS